MFADIPEGVKSGGWQECHCVCHSSEGAALHCMPCCSPCSFCCKNITGDLEAHIREEHSGAVPREASMPQTSDVVD
jgi:hypothetical protein